MGRRTTTYTSRAAWTAVLAVLAMTPAQAAGRLSLKLSGSADGDAAAAVASQMVRALEEEGIQVVADAAGSARQETTDDALRAAAAAGCELTVVGHVEVTGYRIDAELVASETGRSLSTETASGPREDVFDLIDEMGRLLARDIRAVHLPQGTVAVLGFDNRASAESAPFVSGIPQMLLTSLRQFPELSLVEPQEVEKGKQALATATSGAGAAALGRWLGADAAVTGVFTEEVHVELDLLSTSTGRRLGRFARRSPRSDLATLAQELTGELIDAVDSHRRTTRTVAVLPFQNHDEERYDRFVKGIADMLTTSLGQAERFTVIERIQIETAMRNFNLEMSGPIDSETAVEVGAWLGADAVVLGSFLKFGGVFRIDARLIDAETGEVLAAERKSGPEDGVMDMVDDLGHALLGRYEEREPMAAVGTGTLEVVFRTTKTEMGERPVYHHICRLYVDGKYLGLSPSAEKVNRWTSLFSQTLRAGPHRVQVLHGFVKQGEWDGQMPVQPEAFDVIIEPGSVSTLRYTYEVGWFKDRYLHEGAWADAR